MKLNSPELQSRLAAEYVLGTMKGAARRRFEDYLHMPQHRALREAVAAWEAHLTPMTDALPPVPPPQRVWNRIEAQLGWHGKELESRLSTGTSKQNAVKTPANKGLFGSFAFWRNLALGASSLAAVLLVTLLTLRTEQDPMMMAVLEDQGVARMVVEQPKSGLLMVKMVKPWKPSPNNSMELWVIPTDGKPRSLGVVNDTGETKMATGDMDIKLADGLVFALSKEPKGGSPTGQPTGAILCKGAIAKMPPKPKKPLQI
jgi:anti-sigma-K factor RskA